MKNESGYINTGMVISTDKGILLSPVINIITGY